MPRPKYFRHRAEGEVFLLTSPFIGLGDKNETLCDGSGVAHIYGQVIRSTDNSPRPLVG